MLWGIKTDLPSKAQTTRPKGTVFCPLRYVTSTLVTVIITSGGCTAKIPEAQSRNEEERISERQEDWHLIAKALARYLSSEEDRDNLASQMRTSGRPAHSLNLDDYLASAREGERAGESVARMQEVEEIERLAGNLDLELVVPISWDRMQWQPMLDIVVSVDPWHEEAMQADTLEDGPLGYEVSIRDVYSVGFGTDGSEFLFLPTERLPYPLLLVRPDSYVGRGSRNREWMNVVAEHRGTISSRAEEYGLSGSRTSAAHNGRAIRTLQECTGDFPASVDVDQDRLLDACEYEIAREFRPKLVFDEKEKEQNVNRNTFWEVRRADSTDLVEQDPPRTRREVENELWVMYALGYHYDGGRYWLTWHQGDSEFVILSVGPRSGEESDSMWTVTRICFAAHWGVKNEFHRCYNGNDPEVSYWEETLRPNRRAGRPFLSASAAGMGSL